MFRRSCLATMILAASFGAYAQSGNQAQTNTQEGEIIAIEEWNYEALYDNGGLQADNLMDTEVFGPEGEEIGSVENIVLDGDNQIVGIIAQVGGVWDIGDTHVAVPWNEVTVTDDGVRIPVTEETAEDYGLFGPESFLSKQDLQQTLQVSDEVVAGDRTWKITDLLDDYVSLEGGEGYGYVEDVIFSDNGQIEAVIVESTTDYGTGPYAYPFYGFDYDWEPGYDAYQLPYGENEVTDLETFDYEEFEGA